MSKSSDDPKPIKLKLSGSKQRTDSSNDTASANTADPSSASLSALSDSGPGPRSERTNPIQLKNPSAQADPPAPPEPSTPDALLSPLPTQVASTPPLKPLESTTSQPAEQTMHGADEHAVHQPDQNICEDPSDSPDSTPPHSLGGLLVVVALFLIVAAAATGIWYLLHSATTTANNNRTTEVSTNNPVQAVKQTIENVQGDKFEMGLNQTITNHASIQKLAADTNSRVINLRDAVTDYLQNADISGVRTGSNARIMLNGESYNINDVVDQGTGLKFIGTRNQQLRFKDRNEIVYLKSF